MPDGKMTVVGFGDSITLAAEQPEEGKWLTILGRMLTQRTPGVEWKMVNAGVGGNTLREGFARFDSDVLSHRPDIVLIEFGGNDAVSNARHVPLGEFSSTLKTIMDGLKAIDARVVLLTFPPIIDEWHSWGPDPYYAPWGGPDRCVEEYRKITREFARDHGLSLVDLDAALREAGRKDGIGKFIMPDGVHLTAEGNQVVADAVFKVLSAGAGIGVE